MSARYPVSTSRVEPRPLLAVRARLTLDELPARIPGLLQRVYDAGAAGDLLDGQNVLVYRGMGPAFDVELGVGLSRTTEPPEGLVLTGTPAGEAAHATHWGEYGGIPRAHQAVVAWCVANDRALAGVNWEVCGHWNDDPAQRRTDVYYLLEGHRFHGSSY